MTYIKTAGRKGRGKTMQECYAYGDTLARVYHEALECLYEQGVLVDCPDYNTTQKEVSMTMFVEEPLKEPMISKMIPCGTRELEQYRMEMLDGILDFEVKNGKWDYTYHERMVDQFDFIVRELRRNPDSRRAVILVRDNKKDMYSSDPACLQHIQYFIRDGKLHCKVLFRSNDAVKASYMNAFALIMLQKRFAEWLDVEMGTYTHRANSYHVYERDFELLKSYVHRIREAVCKHDRQSLTYNYEGDWKEMMDEEQESILADVDKLKGR